jgi:hypothetical protein
MAQTASVVTNLFVGLLSDSSSGVSNVVGQLAQDSGIELAPLPAESIVAQNVPAAIAERATAVKYPAMYVYSNRVRNTLKEKFRTFSGKVTTVAEIRVSQDRIEGIEDQTRLYTDAVTQVLDANRGSWGQGAFFTGGYEVSFEPVAQGGKKFLQVAKVSFDVDFSS